jgi:nucleotide-binding universal stress UspA family protein
VPKQLFLGVCEVISTKPVRRVVVATDFSSGSMHAVERAALLARAHGACLDLLHAFDANAWNSLRAVFDMKHLAGAAPREAEQRQRLRTLAESLAVRDGLDVESHFGLGVPAAAIEARVRATHAALVVVARRSDPAVAGVGSTLLRVLRQAPCPLLVVRTPAATAYQHVLTAVDLNEVSLRAAARAVELFPKATHRLLHVVDTAWEQEVWRGRAGAEPFDATLRAIHARATRRLQALVQELGLPPDACAAVEAEVVDAVASRGIVEHAAAWPADCVVVGRHGQGMVTEALLGSTALDAIHHAACDVLVVP